ncbi:hypothetical protein [Shewanella baltica]|uniref:hypothetical protein n=1 Tax=Shewanella baltica TaxID=62322 RepID=UPI0032181B74
MPYITGVLNDGCEYKKSITKKTRVLRLDNEEFNSQHYLTELNLSNLSCSENIESIIFHKSLYLTQENLNDIGKCRTLKELHLTTDKELDFSVLQDSDLEKLVIYFIGGSDLFKTLVGLKKLVNVTVEFSSETDLSLECLPPSVQKLTISGNIVNFELSKLEHLTLKELSLKGLPACELNFSVEMAQNLELLCAVYCHDIGNFHSLPFHGSTKLKTINFTGTYWEHLFIDEFCELESLKWVILTDTMRIVADLSNKKIVSSGWKRWEEYISCY